MRDRDAVISKAQEIFREVLDAPELALRDDMVAQDVENWDSLNHITLVMALEEEFDVKFVLTNHPFTRKKWLRLG